MTLRKHLAALGVPPLVYDWSLDALPKCEAKRLLEISINGIDKFIGTGGVIIITVSNGILASRLGVTILKAALLTGYLNVGYVTPSIIKDLDAESWSGGISYDEYLHCDLLVIDNIHPDVHPTKFVAYLEFLENRLRFQKATVITSSKSPAIIFNSRITDIIEGLKQACVHIKEKDL